MTQAQTTALADQVAAELRQAADRLLSFPHCGGKHTDCGCDYAGQLAGLLRDYAAMVDDDPDWAASMPATALDIVRRINSAELETERDPVPFVDYLPLDDSAEVTR